MRLKKKSLKLPTEALTTYLEYKTVNGKRQEDNKKRIKKKKVNPVLSVYQYMYNGLMVGLTQGIYAKEKIKQKIHMCKQVWISLET